MQKAGILVVLLALALVQVPVVLCHSDCHAATLPLWALDAHHCHDGDAAHRHGACVGHVHPETPISCDGPAQRASHPPGEHDLAGVHGVRVPAAPSLPSVFAGPTLVAVPAAPWVLSPATAIAVTPAPPARGGSPHAEIANVRLLL